MKVKQNSWKMLQVKVKLKNKNPRLSPLHVITVFSKCILRSRWKEIWLSLWHICKEGKNHKCNRVPKILSRNGYTTSKCFSQISHFVLQFWYMASARKRGILILKRTITVNWFIYATPVAYTICCMVSNRMWSETQFSELAAGQGHMSSLRLAGVCE